MLNRILTEADCARCKLCCNFYENELWEAPIIGDEVCYDENGLYFCPELGESGCKLGRNKPFDCEIYPFRVMKLADYIVIALSPLCKKVNNMPLSELTALFADDHTGSPLLAKIKAQVEKHPAQIKDYIKDYTILKVL
jgi:hypothetical protein